jgi:hypothetical protein
MTDTVVLNLTLGETTIVVNPIEEAVIQITESDVDVISVITTVVESIVTVTPIVETVVQAFPAGMRGEGFDNITSTSNIQLTLGIKTFIVNRIGAYIVGSRVRIVSNIGWLEGDISAINHSNNTITLTADLLTGSGSANSWSFSLSGIRGLQGLQGQQGSQGIKGDTGAGSGAVLTMVATSDLGGNRAVTLVDNNIAYASSDVNNANGVIGFTARAITIGEQMDIVTSNDLGGFSNLIAGQPIYLSTNGTITQTIPTTGIFQVLGSALTSTKINIKIQPPIGI